MRHHFLTKTWSFEITFTNSNFALLSFHYCIVQQASSTAKATLTAQLMSGNSCTFFSVRFYWKSFKHIFVLQTSKYIRLLVLVIFVQTVAFPFSPTPVASPNSPLLQGIGFIVPFRAVLHHLERMDQYFDIYKRPIVLEGEANILITVVVNMVTPGHGNWSKNNRTFNLSFLVLQCRTSQPNFHLYQFNTTTP